MRIQKPEKKVLKKMKREYDDFDFINAHRRSKTKKPRRGHKLFTDDNEEFDYHSNEE
mgnify:FL=1